MTYKLDDFDSEVEMLEKINEQQSIIHRDEMSIKTMMSNMKKLEEENECLLSKNKRLNAFIVSKDLATEYLEWNRG